MLNKCGSCVEQQHLDGFVPQPARHLDAGEPATNDDHSLTPDHGSSLVLRSLPGGFGSVSRQGPAASAALKNLDDCASSST